jgi:hypothetical protein
VSVTRPGAASRFPREGGTVPDRRRRRARRAAVKMLTFLALWLAANVVLLLIAVMLAR